MAAVTALIKENPAQAGSSPRKDGPLRWRTQPLLLDGEPWASTLQWYEPPRRPYSRRELLADRSVNFLGAGFAWFASLLLSITSWHADDPVLKQVAFWLHGAGLIIMLNCSAFYHYWAWDWSCASKLLSLDHIGISAMITGCYAPVMVQCSCHNVFGFVCLLGLAVVPMEAVRLWQLSQKESSAVLEKETVAWSKIDILHIIRYLVMGWSCLFCPSLPYAIPFLAACPIVVGGLLYTSGVFIFVKDSIEFHLAIWHSFVLLASVCFYLTNLLVLVGRPIPVF